MTASGPELKSWSLDMPTGPKLYGGSNSLPPNDMTYGWSVTFTVPARQGWRVLFRLARDLIRHPRSAVEVEMGHDL